MIKQKQLFKHNPPDFYGDCHRTCLACLLNLQPMEVPNFADFFWDDIPKWIAAEKEFLASVGMATFTIAFDGGDLSRVLNSMGAQNPDTYYMLTGKSRNETNHVVICKNNEIVWDPSIDDSGIISCATDGYYWINVLIPLLMIEKEILSNAPKEDPEKVWRDNAW